MTIDKQAIDRIKQFYDEEYYSADAESGPLPKLPWHSRLIASRLGDLKGKEVLDVACGRGEWLGYLQAQGSRISGIDLSSKAIESCRTRLPNGDFACGPAESLPFESARFDLVTCLGSLEHFVDKPLALREMARVGRPDAAFLILVPNAGFLTRRLGLYGGTNQAHVQEDVLALDTWNQLLKEAGLKVCARWRDLHTFNMGWIRQGRTPVAKMARAAQAIALSTWPIAWQYQVYHHCVRA